MCDGPIIVGDDDSPERVNTLREFECIRGGRKYRLSERETVLLWWIGQLMQTSDERKSCCCSGVITPLNR